MSLPTSNVKSTSEQLKESSNCVTITTMSFGQKKRVNDTELSKYLWELKEENVDYNLQWSI